MTFFKPEDFRQDAGTRTVIASEDGIANLANHLLERRGIRVVGLNDKYWYEQPGEIQTHKALLICIEELPKKKCEHDAELFAAWDRYRCRLCGVKLRAKWEVDNEQK